MGRKEGRFRVWQTPSEAGETHERKKRPLPKPYTCVCNAKSTQQHMSETGQMNMWK